MYTSLANGMRDLELRMQAAQDTKKEFRMSKDTQEWFWFNRGDEEAKGPFPTFWVALCDATEPYMDATP